MNTDTDYSVVEKKEQEMSSMSDEQLEQTVLDMILRA